MASVIQVHKLKENLQFALASIQQKDEVTCCMLNIIFTHCRARLFLEWMPFQWLVWLHKSSFASAQEIRSLSSNQNALMIWRLIFGKRNDCFKISRLSKRNFNIIWTGAPSVCLLYLLSVINVGVHCSMFGPFRLLCQMDMSTCSRVILTLDSKHSVILLYLGVRQKCLVPHLQANI